MKKLNQKNNTDFLWNRYSCLHYIVYNLEFFDRT